jgi:5-methyltetrahydrofolate corrinoid/iron sulfur protein methyltransferase
LLVIGERINSSRRQIAEAVAARDAAVIRREAKAQAAAGADYLDVNAGTFVGEEESCLKWIIEVVQEVTDLPICLDSPDPEVIKSVLPRVKGKPLINSISLEPGRLNKILPLVIEYEAKVIALCQTEDAMAETTEAKVRMAAQLVEKATSGGVPLGDLYIDPLVYPLSTNSSSALATLEAIEEIMGQFPGVHTTCGLTNVSYGLPDRKMVNRTFLVAAIFRGLDSAILDPTDKPLYGSLKAALMVAGKDEFCMGYITAFREGRFE